ncbi:MAG TPA: oligoribonuclease [Candidatus Paceibacterota bacterium]|nr:oligoribonuclease [Candidatus Paceibacterota bacterium]
MLRNDLLCWMDLEMTSVRDARKDQIIEIAVLLTDANLNVVAEGPDLVIHADAALFADIPDSARELHEKSGLIGEVAKSTITITQAEEQVLAFLKEHVEPKTAPLCGNSIHMDRHFLKLQMPKIDEYLFYRCIDVSTIKELARRWKPSIYEEAKARKGESAHRAMDDIKASISELAFYRGALFL